MALQMHDPAPRILVLRPDHLGDLLLTFPALEALRIALPFARIEWLVAEGMEEVARLCPAVDTVRTVPLPDLTLPVDEALIGGTARCMRSKLRGLYDIALLPRPDDPWMAPLAAAADIPCRIGFDRPRTRPYLTVKRPEPGLCHATELALVPVRALLSHLGRDSNVVSPSRAGRLRLEDRHRAEAACTLEDVKQQAGPCPIIIHPGTGWALKNWPVTRWAEVASALVRRSGLPPLVLGAPVERDLVDAVVQRAQGCAVGLKRTLSVGGLAALYHRARMVIAADSGALHLAALGGTPVVGLYGPADPAEFAPLGPRVRMVRVDLPCSPCGTLLDPPCGARAEPACVTGITVDAVIQAAVELLATARQ